MLLLWAVSFFLNQEMTSPTEPFLDLSKYGFFNPSSLKMAVNEERVLCIFDNQENQLLFFHPNQDQVIKTGQPGKGPGEFSRCDGISWSDYEKRFVVFDSGNQRVTLFNSKGVMVGQEDLKVPHTLENPLTIANHWFVFGKNYAGEDKKKSFIRMVNRLSGELKTIWEVTDLKKTLTVLPGKRPIVFYMDWDEKIKFALGRNFIVYHYGSDPKLHIQSLDGKMKRHFFHGLKSRKVTDQQVQEVLALAPQSMKSRLKLKLQRPKVWPNIQKLMVDSRERIWVIGFSAKTGGVPVPFKIFSRDGELLKGGMLGHVPLAITKDASFGAQATDDDGLIITWSRSSF